MTRNFQLATENSNLSNSSGDHPAVGPLCLTESMNYSTKRTRPALPNAPPRRTKAPRQKKVLLLCGGPDARLNSITSLLGSAGFTCCNFDIANGPTGDLRDGVIFDPIERDVDRDEYSACGASPECGSFSKLHNLPGPPPLRAVSGIDRYGYKSNSPEDAERVRQQNLICIRIAKILTKMTSKGLPWYFECPAAYDNQVSVLHLDEYIDLLALPGV